MVNAEQTLGKRVMAGGGIFTNWLGTARSQSLERLCGFSLEESSYESQ